MDDPKKGPDNGELKAASVAGTVVPTDGESAGIFDVVNVDDQPRRRSLRFENLVRTNAPRGYLRVDQALDQIGQLEFSDWGTQPGFHQLPIVRRADGYYRLIFRPAAKNRPARFVRLRLKKRYRRPPMLKSMAQLRAARAILREGIEVGSVRAMYEGKKDHLLPVPLLRWLNYPKSTLFCGVTRDENQRFKRIFIHEDGLKDWLHLRAHSVDTVPISRQISEGALRRIASAIGELAAREGCRPNREYLTSCVQETVRKHRGRSLTGAQLIVLRNFLPNEFATKGAKPKEVKKRSLELRPAFIQAIELALD